jgi:hypothetical protein
MTQTVTIKLKPYLQEYLKCKLAEPLTASSKNIIGVIMHPFLEYRPKNQPPFIPQGDEYITFELPRPMGFDIRSGTVYISERNQENFERILNNHFKDLFFSYVDDKNKMGFPVKKCILQFCSDYNISFNHINYEMLKKSYYRRLREGKKNIFPTKLSLSCPLFFLMF